MRRCKRLERRIRATPSAPHPSYAYKLVSAPVRFARNSLPHPPTGTHTRFVQKRTRNAKPISMSCMDSRFRGRKCQLALPFPPAEAKLLVTPTECWFIQNFKDEISVIGAQVPQEEPFGIENIHSPISVPYRVQLTPGGWCKVAAYDILRRKEVVKIRTTSPDGRKAQ